MPLPLRVHEGVMTYGLLLWEGIMMAAIIADGGTSQLGKGNRQPALW